MEQLKQEEEEVLNEEPTTNNIDSSDVMAAYTAAIKKTHKRALNNYLLEFQEEYTLLLNKLNLIQLI